MLSVSGLGPNIAIFVAAAILITYIGPKLSRSADRMGEATGLGDTIAGAIFLGATTSLSGIVAALRSAAIGQPDLAVGTAIGSIAAQTFFLGIADALRRKGTLTETQRLSDGLMQTAVLMSLLTLILLAMLAPAYEIFGVHPISPVIIIGGILGFWAIYGEQRAPAWLATEDGAELLEQVEKGTHHQKEAQLQDDDPAVVESAEPVPEEFESEAQRELEPGLLGRFLLHVGLIFIGGWFVSSSAEGIMTATGWSPVLIGSTLMGGATSLAEAVTAFAAVRQERVGLAIGDIVGGNAFDTMVVASTDFFYLQGSIYSAVASAIHLLDGMALLMTAILLIGFIRRERRGLGGIGIESYLLMAVYIIGLVVILWF